MVLLVYSLGLVWVLVTFCFLFFFAGMLFVGYEELRDDARGGGSRQVHASPATFFSPAMFFFTCLCIPHAVHRTSTAYQ